MISMTARHPTTAPTEVCGVFSPSLHDPPLHPNATSSIQDNSVHLCPRCDYPYTRRSQIKKHFRRCIKTNGNPDSLHWFDSKRWEGNMQKKLESTTTVISDELKAMGGMAKVGRWAAMALEKERATTFPISSNWGKVRPSTPPESTTVAKSTPVQMYKPVADKPASTPRKKPRKLEHNEYTAHLFNNAGEVIPSIPGIDPVTERLFDQGVIMSLGPLRAQDTYYPDGEPPVGSFVLESCNGKKRKGDSGN